MKTLIRVDNEFCTIQILRDGFSIAKFDFMSDDNHGDLCRCLTEGEACKLAADIAHSTNSEIDPQMAFSKIKDNVSRHFKNREIEL